MAERAEPSQNRRHQPPHQRAVAIGQGLQAGMGAGAVELIVKRAMLVQNTVEDVGCDSPCRETGHFGRYCESGSWHEAAMSRKAERFWLVPLDESCLASEYAKCKNRHRQFRECDVI